MILILLSFSVYQNFISPAQIPLYTLSNGEKTLRFQTMSHVASPEFYSLVQNNIRTSKQEDFILFFEGVRPGSDESIETFNGALGIDFGPDLYSNFSKLYGIVSQDNDDFLNIVNNLDFNVDLDLDTVVEKYEAKQESLGVEASQEQKIPDEVLDINSEIITMLAELNPRELTAVRFLNQAIMNFMIKNEGLRNILIDTLGNTDIFGVILDDRNEYLVQEILTSDFDKIHILYGLMHFDGVFKLLQQNDTNWEIIETEYSQVIVQDFGL
ncbi:hypothetical protein N9J72_03315 [Candidatus Gracilibacteria bacterium]|nr:hypothetical protein [Candidatus Gracilibacteria bacterium]